MGWLAVASLWDLQQGGWCCGGMHRGHRFSSSYQPLPSLLRGETGPWEVSRLWLPLEAIGFPEHPTQRPHVEARPSHCSSAQPPTPGPSALPLPEPV